MLQEPYLSEKGMVHPAYDLRFSDAGETQQQRVAVGVKKDIRGRIIVESRSDLIEHPYIQVLDVWELDVQKKRKGNQGLSLFMIIGLEKNNLGLELLALPSDNTLRSLLPETLRDEDAHVQPGEQELSNRDWISTSNMKNLRLSSNWRYSTSQHLTLHLSTNGSSTGIKKNNLKKVAIVTPRNFVSTTLETGNSRDSQEVLKLPVIPQAGEKTWAIVALNGQKKAKIALNTKFCKKCNGHHPTKNCSRAPSCGNFGKFAGETHLAKPNYSTLPTPAYAAAWQKLVEKWWSEVCPARYQDLDLKMRRKKPPELALSQRLLFHLLAIRTGHGDFATYHRRLKHVDPNPECIRGQETSPTYFIRCRRHANQVRKLCN
ncbi:hypothetical protein EPUL_005389, partial [Erysiphe pulchra]